MKIETIEQARRFVIQERICTVFSGKSKTLESLWDGVDLPEKQPGEKKVGDRKSVPSGVGRISFQHIIPMKSSTERLRAELLSS